MARQRLYASIIEEIFRAKFQPGMREVPFTREELATHAQQLGLPLPKNLGDLVYSFRYRAAFPDSVQSTASEGFAWIIRPAGRSRYRFVLVADRPLTPNENIVPTKIPDATPGVIAKYAFNDEQALLARLRYNRLVDIFLGIACYSLQNHLRTTVPDMGQVETDELYVGLDKKGSHFVIPVQAKGGKDKLSVVQIEQDLALCAHRFRTLVCRPVAAQFMKNGVIALFEFEQGDEGVGIVEERHYKLVPPGEITEQDLENYRNRLAE